MHDAQSTQRCVHTAEISRDFPIYIYIFILVRRLSNLSKFPKMLYYRIVIPNKKCYIHFFFGHSRNQVDKYTVSALPTGAVPDAYVNGGML